MSGAASRGPRQRPQFGWQSLTPTQRTVVALAADGLSKLRIGKRLFISRRTPLDADSCRGSRPGPGKSFRPLRFTADGCRADAARAGGPVPRYRHTGEVHAFDLAGTWEIFGTGERAGPIPRVRARRRDRRVESGR